MSFYNKIIDLQKLQKAWEHVRKNKPANGVDGVSCEAFDANKKAELQQLHQELAEHRYESLPVRQITLYKGDKARKIALFSMRDKVVQQSLASELIKLYDPFFSPSVYAYRPGRSALEAANQVEAAASRYAWALKADIEHFFDCIDRAKLIGILGSRIYEEDVLELVHKILEARLLQDDGTLKTNPRGILQGSSVSPVLSNIYMMKFDHAIETQTDFYVRYSDDILILGKSKEELVALYEKMKLLLEEMGLQLNQEKTVLCPVQDSFSFLGYCFDSQGRQIPQKAELGLAERLESMWLTSGRQSLEEKLRKGAEILGGWEQYYRQEHIPGSILEYAIVLHMAVSGNGEKEVIEKITAMRPSYDNTYRDLLEFFVKEWKRLQKPQYLALEYEQFFQVPKTDVDQEIWNKGILYQELLSSYERLLVCESEEEYGQLIQLYSDLGCYNRAACMQERRNKFRKQEKARFQIQPVWETCDISHREYEFTAQDIQNYMSLFVGREDLYSQETLQYGGKRKIEPVMEPLTESVLQAHLKGDITIGSYVQRPNHTAHTLILDVDISKKILLQNQGNQEAVKEYLQLAAKHTVYLMDILEQLGLKGYPEFSGYRGYHIWVFFTEWMPVRYLHMLEDVIEKLYQSRKAEEIQLEFFPNKVRVRQGSAGQSIKLPYGLHTRSQKASAMCNQDLSPVDNIGGFLKDAARFSLQAVKKILSVHLSQEQNAEMIHPETGATDGDLTEFGELSETVAAVLQNCSLVRYLCQKARKTGYLGHFERLSVLYVFGHLGETGKEFVHQVMGYTLNYQYHVTEKFIRKLPEKPVSCIKLRDQYKTITAEYGCSCVFKRTQNCYPSPVLHAIRDADTDAGEVTLPTSRTLTKEKEKDVYEEINIHKKVQEIAGRILEFKKQKRSLDKSIEKLEKELENVYDRAGVDCLEIEMGLLTRRKTERGYEWMIQI